MEKQKLVLIGNGMAGVRCIENILREGPNLFDITIFGSEPHPNYSRIMLSSVLQGTTSFEDIVVHQRSWYEENNIRLFCGETVTEIDKDSKLVKTDQLREIPYDKLIIATGSSPFILPLPGAEKEGVISFRTIEDCQSMMETAKSYKKAVVIGGGLLGLEAARGLLDLGMQVDVVHRSRFLMEKQLDQVASQMLQNELESQGMNFLLEKESEKIVGEERVKSIRFKDGSEVNADLVVMAVGVRPNVQLAKCSGIETNRGILVDNFLSTTSKDIYAVGECAEHQGTVYGLVKPLYEQGEVLAKYLCGRDTLGYYGSVISTQLKVSGVDVFSVGRFTTDEHSKTITHHNEIEGIYKKVNFKGNKAVGAVLFGEIQAGPRLLDTIVKEKVVSDQDKVSLLESPDPADSFVAAISPSEQICTCNSVTKGAIINAVQKDGVSTIDEVKRCTKASSSCGGCKPTVSELLDYIYSDHFNEGISTKALCSCTSLEEDKVVEEIQVKSLTNIQEIMRELEWKNKQGCSICRPALDYYLSMIYSDYEQKNEHLFLNEHAIAMEQNDGTYAIVPQFYGGVLDSKKFKKIASVVERYPGTSVAISTDQRIHIWGIREEYLRRIWSDLNMPLRSPEENMVKIIKTSIGEYGCGCNPNSAFNLAESLERKTELLKTPDRIKVGISSCLHNKANAISMDVGVSKMSRGWEIYVGGSNGRKARTGELLYVAPSDKEAGEMIAGFIQYYRESAKYLERVCQWIDRVGLIHIREVLLNEEIRTHLLHNMYAGVLQRKINLANNSLVNS